jgi:hypothetical protein
LNSLHARIICIRFEIGWLVLEKTFSNISVSKNAFPNCCPKFWPPGTMILINFNLHYIRKPSCKFDLFWPRDFEKKFKWSHPIFVIIFPLKMAWSFICTNLNSHYAKMIFNEFDWNWQGSSREGDFRDFFAIQTHVNRVFPLWRHPTPWDHDSYKLESALIYIRKLFCKSELLALWFLRRF